MSANCIFLVSGDPFGCERYLGPCYVQEIFEFVYQISLKIEMQQT